jgi:hypothetical protein
MEPPSLINAINQYYILKSKYEEVRNRKKKSIINNEDLSRREKRQRIKKIPVKCIKCNQSGGTIFTNTRSILKAICGSSPPCDLHIEINKGTYENLRAEDSFYEKDIDYLKDDIIMTKLDYLFGYEDQDRALSLFDKFREELTAKSEIKMEMQEKMNIVYDNSQNSARLKKAEVQLFIEIENIRKIHAEYTKTQEPNLIKTIAENYLSIIQPLNEQIRGLKYAEIYVHTIEEQEIGYHWLIALPYTLNQTEIVIPNKKNPARVISYII